MLQTLKDAVIAAGWEPALRPLWNRLTHHVPDRYDAAVFGLIARHLTDDAVCIDVGAHKGLILDACRRQCCNGRFHAIEPIPRLAQLLRRKYRRDSRVRVHECALSAERRQAPFYVDVDEPGCSGLRVRDRRRKNLVLPVQVCRLDELLPETEPDFIKIDVEGAELQVLQGAEKSLRRSHPLVVFEHGLGGADHFGARPEQIFDLLAACGLAVSLIGDFIAKRAPLSRTAFVRQFDEHLEYYFVAHPAAA